MCGEWEKLKHWFESDSRQCCIIGLKIKQLDWRNVWIKKFGHLHEFALEFALESYPKLV